MARPKAQVPARLSYADSTEPMRASSGMARSPRRIPVSQSAREVVRSQTQSGWIPWDPDVAPYVVEPMNSLSMRQLRGVVFVGPARTGKTEALMVGWLAHALTADPGKMIFYFAGEDNKKSFVRDNLRSLHQHSPAVAEYLSSRAHDTGLTRVFYNNGHSLELSYPTSAKLSQRSARYIGFSDYDSMSRDISGEGLIFDLGRRRTAHLLSAGKTMAESSPKRPILKPDWQPSTPHEAPPCDGGIMPLYNRGDRRRWQWQCPHCGAWFEPPPRPEFEPGDDIEQAARSAYVPCRACGAFFRPEDKRILQLGGPNNLPARWLPDLCTMDADGRIVGTPPESVYRSYWLKGCAAAFQPWSDLVRDYLQAMRTFEATGDDGALITHTNTGEGMPYLPRALRSERSSSLLRERAADEHWLERFVPEGVRYLHGVVDVQHNRFVVQVIGRGVDGERWLIDRYQILDAPNRRDLDGNPQPIGPMSYPEDWAALDDLLARRYPLADGSRREMSVRLVACDSGGAGAIGGRESVTRNSYTYWLRQRSLGNGDRFRLLKGEAGGETRAGIRRTYVDSKRNPGTARAVGDVPLILVNNLAIKDELDRDLKRDEPGPGYIHLPAWIDDEVFEELCAETRGPQRWEKRRANEAWDLLGYDIALQHLTEWEAGAWNSRRAIDWTNPPPWADEWDKNPLVTGAGQAAPAQVEQRQVQGRRVRLRMA